MQPFQALLCFAQVTWVGNRLTLRRGEKFLEAQVNANLFASRNMLNMPLCIDGKLAIVAISPSHDAYPLDELDGVFLYPLPFVANQTQAPDATPISEADMLAIRFQFPPRLLVFY